MKRDLHGLNSAYLDFKIVVDLIKTGYRFDDQNAPRVVEQLEKALEILKAFCNRLQKPV